ncbi:ornithine decarboxylase [Glutamicibacter sp.]|uniref:aminotransferase class I/II-fold pyridoxal phosphate-dependent enzyme n=1 Tax=Glutamicibacter sp. TaxID=1931995 RepID=UPI002FC5EB82
MSKRLTYGTNQGTATPESAWRKRKDAWEHLGYVLSEISSEYQEEDRRTEHELEAGRLLGLLAAIEPYWANPGIEYFNEVSRLMSGGQYEDAMKLVYQANQTFRTLTQYIDLEGHDEAEQDPSQLGNGAPGNARVQAPMVEILLVDNGPAEEIELFKEEIAEQRQRTDPFHYNFVVVPSVEDALAAILINPGIQSVVLTARFDVRTRRRLSSTLKNFIARRMEGYFQSTRQIQGLLDLENILDQLRPEVPVYLIAGVALESIAHEITGRFRRIFSRNDRMDLHLSIVSEVLERYQTPFFNALQKYAKRPGGVFHAMPISRAGSVQNSPWARDLVDFYGKNLLLAETSATSGGLDSLLDPQSSIKKAHELAARAFGSHRTYFVTNGTSTANKIVHQSILAPGDIVLVDRNCHKSHHYSLVLAGANVSYLEAYPLNEHSMYGAVPLEEIKGRLLQLRREGLLHKVKMLTLTNCTFDGIIYDPRRVMEECLAIKPDLVFLWDEAWFAFAGFHPVYRQRTAMTVAAVLEKQLETADYHQRYAAQRAALPAPGTVGHPENDQAWLDTRLIPDPEQVRLRVYSTQSTHKTLTSLRQGSMIHIYDQDFAVRNLNAFREAYMTHTSTSPNYQILASLDIGRRQAELEGYALVQRQVDLAQSISRAMARNELLGKYFKILHSTDLIPQKYRRSTTQNPVRDGLAAWDEAWAEDEFVVDPSRLTLDISRTGVDGDTFKHEYLMDGHSIQVNKTSRTSVLLMTNIGTTRSAVAHLIEVLVKIAEELDRKRRLDGRVLALGKKPAAEQIPLPDFSAFAPEFAGGGGSGDMRSAYYLTYQDPATHFLSSAQIRTQLVNGERVVSAVFVTPYPPGFPVLVPGQVITMCILDYMDRLDTREIHGYHQDLGYQVFTCEALEQVAAQQP